MFRLIMFSWLLICLWSCEDKELKIAKESIARNPKNFTKLPKQMQTNKDLALMAIEKEPKIYNEIDFILKEDINFVKQATKLNFDVYFELSSEMKKSILQDADKHFSLFVIEKNPEDFVNINEILKEDMDFFKQAFEKKNEVLEFASEKFRKKNKKEIAEIIDAKIKVQEQKEKEKREAFFKELEKQSEIVRKKMLEDNLNNLKLVLIKGGDFMMGSDDPKDNNPIHKVSINDFYITKTEVTQRQYEHCYLYGPCPKQQIINDCNPLEDRGIDAPIHCISWDEARLFAKWIGGDLPTEEQWEYAARSEGKDIKYPWGNETPSCSRAVMVWDDSNEEKIKLTAGCILNRPTKFCSKEEGNSKQGLCDMAGNVAEWMLDKYIGVEYCKDTNQNDCKSVRGGDWKTTAKSLHCTKRDGTSSETRSRRIGFRVAFASTITP